MKIEKSSFGTDNKGRTVECVTIENSGGTQVKIATLGAAVVSFLCKDKTGKIRDIVLGYDDAPGYIKGGCYFGAIIGRNANRIADAKITINGNIYELEKNDGNNNLHSGSNCTSYQLWELENLSEADGSVTMKYFSADGEQGFPGNMGVKVTYTLDEENALHIHYEAVSDADTVANFTNHSYFNLGGHDSGSVFGQQLKIYAEAFTPVASTGSIPTGEIRPVEGTPFDFREFKKIGKDADLGNDQLSYNGGYDHNFVLSSSREVGIMAEAICEETGIHLYAYTDRPGVHLYAANYVENQLGKNQVIYNKHHAFCLEAQYFPNAMNEPAFESPLLKAGEVYKATTIYKVTLD